MKEMSANPDSFEVKVEAALQEYIDERLAALSEKREKLVGLLYDTHEEFDAYLVNEKERFGGLNREAKVTEMLNNFHCWWPGGHYRVDSVKEGSPNAERNRQLLTDLDAFILENGDAEVAASISSKESTDSKRKSDLMMKAYLYLRAKGYSRSEMVR